MILKFVFLALLIHMESKAESIEDTNPFSYSNTNAVNFNEIFSYTSSLIGGDTAIVPDVKEDEYSLHIMPTNQLADLNKTPTTNYVQNFPPATNYVKNPSLLNNRKGETFHSETTTESDLSNASFERSTIRRIFPSWMTSPTSSTSATSTKSTTSSTTTPPTTPTTTENIETTFETFVIVSSTRDPSRQRGILDLLFPAKRVKSFKTMFDAFRNLLSHTFRR